MTRTWTPDQRDPETGITTVNVKRACNGCGTRLGDVTDEEMSAVMSDRPLPDVRGECPVCGSPPHGVTLQRPLTAEDGEFDYGFGDRDRRGIVVGDQPRCSTTLGNEWALYLPHSCDEWVIGEGSKEAVLAYARKFRDELNAAITALEQS